MGIDKKNPLLKLLSIASPFKIWIILNIIASAISAVIDIAAGFFIKNITDAALQKNIAFIIKMLFPIAVVVSIGILVKFFAKYSAGRFTALSLNELRKSIITSLDNMSYQTVQKHQSGDIISRLSSDQNAVQTFFQNNLSNIIYQPLVLFVAFIYLFYLNFILSLISFAVIMISVYFVKRFSKPVTAYAKDIQLKHVTVNSIAQDSISGITSLKAYNLEKLFSRKYKIAVEDLYFTYLKKNSIQVKLIPINILIEHMPLLSAICLGSFLVFYNTLSIGGLFAYIYLLQYLSSPLNAIPELIIDLRSAGAAAKRIIDIINVPAENKKGKNFNIIKKAPYIEFDNVSFSYDDNKPVLKNICFKVEKNSRIAIAGKSGSGKTTIFRLLCRNYTASTGRISLFGHDTNNWNLKALLSNLSVVSQDTYLFPGAIIENISYGKPGASRDRIIAAAKTANAHDFIMSFPKGYNTIVGEKGKLLSGGEKQRISIARAVLKDAPVLLLDEPTASLDIHSEEIVIDALEKIIKNKTVIVIAHRLSTIKMAEEILVLHNGCIAETGCHETLIKRKDHYYDLYLSQLKEEESHKMDNG